MLCIQVYKCQHSMVPGYLAELCKPVANIDGHRHLRSAGQCCCQGLETQDEDKDKESSFKDKDKDLISKDKDKDEDLKIGPRGQQHCCWPWPARRSSIQVVDIWRMHILLCRTIRLEHSSRLLKNSTLSAYFKMPVLLLPLLPHRVHFTVNALYKLLAYLLKVAIFCPFMLHQLFCKHSINVNPDYVVRQNIVSIQ